MSDTKKIRLSKVIKELNIGKDTAIDFLVSKGFKDTNPNSKIDSSQYNLLIEEFKGDKDKKLQSAQISTSKKKEKESIENEIREREEDFKKKKLEAKQKEEQTKQESQKEENLISNKREILKGPKILGKIETITEKPQQKKSDPKKEVVKNKPEKQTPKPKEENKPVISEVKTKYQKLSGPKIIGDKMDLSQFEKPNKENKKSVAITTENKKKKRIKRVKKPINQQNNKKIHNKSKKTPIVKKEPTEEEIQKQIKETLDRLTNKGGKSKGSKHRRQKKEIKKEQEELAQQELKERGSIIEINEFVTVNELAIMMDVSINEIISSCMMLGIMVTMNQRLDAETITIVAEEFGHKVNFVSADNDSSVEEIVDEEKDLLPRSPIVTVMGHVDHGKTSLLDYIRNENVIAGEAGGITQHIGAYNVQLENGQNITFLDTPGHEAFTAMRSRGTQVTDIAIILVAADDDIMPQTKEAINHAQAANVPIVFAINKIDKPDANPEKIKEKLAAMNLLVEDWGGKIQSHDISAKKGTGVKELLEKVILEAEILELKANPNRIASGSVIDATLDKGKGYVTTILVQNGTLNVGDYVLAGRYSGKIRAMHNERNQIIKNALPAMPATILGLDGAPQAGDKFNVFKDEKEAKQIVNKRSQLQRKQSERVKKHITLDEIGRRLALGTFKELNVIVKADVDGSAEALAESLQKLSSEEIQVNIIHKGIGQITESDVLLASVSDAIIIGFQVRSSGKAKVLADKEVVDIRNYSIIYDAIEEVKSAMEGMLSPEIKEETTCNIEVRETFKVSKVGTIAGCIVNTGTINRNSKIRVIRDGIVLHTGVLGSLKRFQDDVKEVKKGYECGLNVTNFNDIKIGDILEGYKEVQVQKKL